MIITSYEGLGMNPNGWWGDPHEVQNCHHNSPKYPIPETTILRRNNEEALKNAVFYEKSKGTFKHYQQIYFASNYRRNGAI